MGCYDYLCALLAPLGVYRLDGGASGAELFSAGAALDAAAEKMERAEREGCLATAEDEGLSRREALLSRVGATADAPSRRRAIESLFSIGEDGFTLCAMNAAISGCGVRATVEERGANTLRVRFPDVAGEPEEYEKVREILLSLLPCHLAVEFYLEYLSWRGCEDRGTTWRAVAQAEHSWRSFGESFAQSEAS